MIVTVDQSVCDRSPHCPARSVCPNGAFILEGSGSQAGQVGYTVDQSSCTGCGLCVRHCPNGAVNTRY